MKKPNPSFELATWFVQEILCRKWDLRFDKQHLANAKRLVNPTEGEPLDIDVIKFCLLKLKEGEWKDWKKPVASISTVTWGEPPYYQRAIELIANAPPIYEITQYDTWVVACGKIARRIGVWDGQYRGYDNPLERPFRMDPVQLAEVVGD